MHKTSKHITGSYTAEKLRAHKQCPWLNEGMELYQPDSTVTDSLRILSGDYEILVFGGTWCSDTRFLLPKFMKVASQAGFDERVEYYLLDMNKTSRKKREEKYQIEYVPTFIVLQSGKEKGRIVESVKTSIEQELLEIMTQAAE